jgi:hypothetical protein
VRVFQNAPLAKRFQERTIPPRVPATYTPPLAADARTRRADVRDYHAGKTGRVGLRSDQVRLESRVRWNPLGTNGLPEGFSLHRVRRGSTHLRAVSHKRAGGRVPVKSRQPLLEIGRCVWRVSNGNRPRRAGLRRMQTPRYHQSWTNNFSQISTLYVANRSSYTAKGTSHNCWSTITPPGR